MHLTLRFLGEIKDAQVTDVCEAVAAVAQRHQSFDLSLGGIGHFGGAKARVLWVDVTEGRVPMKALHADLEDELERHGWPREGRPFAAHLTLCRIKRPLAGARLVQVTSPFQDKDYGDTSVEAVTVYESVLSREGARYTALARCPVGVL